MVLLGVACSAPVPVPDAGQDDGKCKPVPEDGGTSHGSSIMTDERWTEGGNPHLIPFDTNIYAGATVRVDPCVVIRVGAGKTVSVTGVLEAQGTQLKPVSIERLDPTKPWASFKVSGGGRLRLTRTTVKGGGDPLNFSPPLAAALDIDGMPDMPTQPVLLVDNVEVQGSASQGVYLHGGGGFASGSVELKVTGSATYPIHSWARSAGTIPSGSYTGNGTDQLVLTASGLAESVSEDVTLRDRGVPYLVGAANSAGTLYVAKPNGLATLTIDPGVTLKFKKGGVLYVDSANGTGAATGALVAVGTAARPIVFTSAEAVPAAGDWLGLSFGSVAAATTQVKFATVEYAGGINTAGSQSCPYPGMIGVTNAAIRILGGAPQAQFITDTKIRKSGQHGIDRGWRDALKIDFLPTNTFTDVPGCNQTFPPDSSNFCPTPVPCPK